MKHLRGFNKRYFSLAIIAMYSTLFKLCRVDSNYIYHLKAFKYSQPSRDPPPSNLI